MNALVQLEVRLYATLRKYAPGLKLGEALEINLKKGSTVENLFTNMNIPKEEVKVVLVNGRAQKHGYVLLNADRVAIFPAVAGG